MKLQREPDTDTDTCIAICCIVEHIRAQDGRLFTGCAFCHFLWRSREGLPAGAVIPAN